MSRNGEIADTEHEQYVRHREHRNRPAEQAIADEAATATRPRQNTVRSWPRSRNGPVAPVVSPPSSATPMIPVSVPVVVPKARSRVGRNGPTQRSAVLATAFAPVNTTSWRRSERVGATVPATIGLAGGTVPR